MIKIRKLYNVLVVGGMAAAGLAGCEKKADTAADPKATTTTTTDPKATTPDPVKVEPLKGAPEPVKVDTTTPTPAVKVADPEPVKVDAKVEPKTVVKKKAPVPAKKGEADGSGAKGWS